MSASITKSELVCYPFRNNLYPRLENPLKKDIDRLSKSIKKILISGQTIQQLPVDILSFIFNLRIKSLKWLSVQNNAEYRDIMAHVFEHFEQPSQNEELTVLNENILFALRCNRRVVENLLKANAGMKGEAERELPEINYEHYLASLAFVVPGEEEARKLAEWTQSSLYIEFVMLAADLLNNGEVQVSNKTINELSFLVADAAQEYAALAAEFGILRPPKVRSYLSGDNLDSSFIKEQKQVAEMGLEEFKKSFMDE